jgi:hypothetical protein
MNDRLRPPLVRSFENRREAMKIVLASTLRPVSSNGRRVFANGGGAAR